MVFVKDYAHHMEGDLHSDPGSFSAETHPTPPPAPSPASEEFQPLDRRIIRLWRITQSIGLGILVLFLSGLLVGLGAGFPGIASVVPYAIGLLLLPVVACIIWYPPRSYRSWGYRIDSKVIEARHGVIFYSTHLLPLNRLQHVDIHRGPLERANGLSSLLLHTAGSQAATLIIPGLDQNEAQRLRDYLVEIGGDDAV